MRLAFSLTFADFKAAFRLHRQQTIARRVNRLIWPVLTIACLIVLFTSNARSQLFAQALGIGVTSLWLSILLPIARQISVRRCYKRILQNGKTDGRCFAEVNDQQVVTGVDGILEHNYSWDGITGFAQDKDTTLFYTSKTSFLFFPTNAMTPEQGLELQAMIAKRGLKR